MQVYLIPLHLFVRISFFKGKISAHSLYCFPPLAASHSSPAGGAKTHTFVCQTPLNLRGRSAVSQCSWFVIMLV